MYCECTVIVLNWQQQGEGVWGSGGTCPCIVDVLTVNIWSILYTAFVHKTVYKCILKDSYIHACIHTYIHAHLHTCTHTHMNTYIFGFQIKNWTHNIYSHIKYEIILLKPCQCTAMSLIGVKEVPTLRIPEAICRCSGLTVHKYTLWSEASDCLNWTSRSNS
jgi:hypothetical protein